MSERHKPWRGKVSGNISQKTGGLNGVLKDKKESVRQGGRECVLRWGGEGYQPQVKGTEGAKGTEVTEKYTAGSENH